ncbi:hypothetical protein GCM10027262_06910 [Nocardia tengchongensis]
MPITHRKHPTGVRLDRRKHPSQRHTSTVAPESRLSRFSNTATRPAWLPCAVFPAGSPIARTATAEERAELWPKVTAKYDVYAAYQQGTTREIPLVLLTPRD